MLVLILGVAMLLGVLVGVYYGFRHQYTATEGTLALLLLEVLFIGIGLTVYGIMQLAQG
ncbi:hypothetical protein ACFL5G_03630 [Candidatus Margulisiibacteriota bacterium]